VKRERKERKKERKKVLTWHPLFSMLRSDIGTDAESQSLMFIELPCEISMSTPEKIGSKNQTPRFLNFEFELFDFKYLPSSQ